MPLWLQGALEFLQSAFLSAVLVVVPLLAVWFAGGFEALRLENVFRLAGQAWLLMHGVPLQLAIPEGADSAEILTGTLSLTPLGLTLIPFFLSWRAGRRIARASYTDQLWQGIAGALGAYLLFGLVTGFAVPTEEVSVNLAAAAFIPLVASGAGVVVGAYREAGSWSRLIGVDSAAWIAKTSQHSRWAGSYVWSVVRAGSLGYLAALGLAALVLSIDLAVRWVDISNIYQQLQAGPVGGSVLTIAQLGLMPNLALWTLAWISGGGVVLGTGSTLSTLETTVGPLPALPVLGALPTGELGNAWVFMLVPVLAGFLAGWWFLREGEDHLDDWLALKITARWASLSLSTLLLGLFTGAVAGIVSLIGSWLAGGSLGIGRLTEIGPNPWLTALLLAAEVAVGAMIGALTAPMLEHDPVLED
ncbi:cell division protein PerM [Zafaria sp. Z1313]|uniref:cell division protein PerM n=1 Tax=unclassified Zafaria TaxID=2828765 RepID=UPI003D3024E1